MKFAIVAFNPIILPIVRLPIVLLVTNKLVIVELTAIKLELVTIYVRLLTDIVAAYNDPVVITNELIVLPTNNDLLILIPPSIVTLPPLVKFVVSDVDNKVNPPCNNKLAEVEVDTPVLVYIILLV